MEWIGTHRVMKACDREVPQSSPLSVAGAKFRDVWVSE